MAKIKYYYDTETCKYERYRISAWEQLTNVVGFLLLTLIFSGGLFYVYTIYLDSPKEALLKKENQEMQAYYDILNQQVEESRQMLSALEKRDDNIYRVVFEAEPISPAIRKAGIGGTERYRRLLEEGLEREELIIGTMSRIDQLKKQMYIQTKSYDEIVRLAKNKERLWASIPAIQPISNQELTALASGFGLRIHPIYKVRKMHTGVDFSAARGTPIYATGDGTVSAVTSALGGYGKHVEIDHGYGYITKYAHMQRFNVKRGQKVKRGECIGYVGSTGTSTAPHLHYEVFHNNKHVNPVYYFFDDLNASQFERILQLASVENQSLGGE